MTAILKLRKYSYRFGEQVLGSSLAHKLQIETALTGMSAKLAEASRPRLSAALKEEFVGLGWVRAEQSASNTDAADIRLDYLKERIGLDIEFGHGSFLGNDLLKFQVASYSGQDLIDVAVYVVTTSAFQRFMQSTHGQKWQGSLTFERVVRCLPQYRSAIDVPIYVLGIDV